MAGLLVNLEVSIAMNPNKQVALYPRSEVGSGIAWESAAAYPRALRAGDFIYVSGTTATDESGPVEIGSAAGQTRFILEKITRAVRQLGGQPEDVVMARVYLKDATLADDVFAVYTEMFGHVRAASTAVIAPALGDEYLVEIEMQAIVGARREV